MADDQHYVPGDFYRLCDRTGFKIRANKTRKEWTNLIVRDESWEARNAQDFVRGVRDDQTVPTPRPRQIDVFVGALQSTMFASAAAGSSSLQVSITTRMLPGDSVSVMMDNGAFHLATISAVPITGTLVITPPLSFSASSGNVVVDTTAVTNLSIDP